jgi:membrane protein implicated in regulation of membrane protease activity
MISTRMLVAAYVTLLLSMATFWLGLHSLPKWVLLAVFFVGFFAASVTVIYPWAKYWRSKEQNPKSSSLESRSEL